MTPEEDLDRRARRIDRLVGVVPYAILAASVLASWSMDTPFSTGQLATAGLAALTAGWLLLVRPRSDGERVRTAVYCVGLVILIAALTTRSAWFAGFFGFIGYIHMWYLLRGPWRIVGVAATAAVTVPAFLGSFPPAGPAEAAQYLLFIGAIVLLVSLFSSLGQVTAQQSAQRKEVIGRLAESNARLSETIRENDELHARLLGQARRAGALDERQRMAEEIHDTLAQGFAGILTQVEAARRAADDPAERDRHLETVAKLGRENLVEARRTVRAVGPAVLESNGLPDAIADVAETWRERHPVAVAVSTAGAPHPLSAEIEVALVRAAQESLANVAKHAAASRVGITLSYMGDEIRLDVRDDGRGFTPGTASGGFGLTAMRQRMDRLAGTLAVESDPGAGTTVSLSVPLGLGAVGVSDA